MLRAPRFFGDDFLADLLDGKTMSATTASNPADSVQSIQQALNDLLISPVLSVSGTFDSATTANVVSYQSARGLVPDGIVGPATMGALDDDFALELFKRKADTPPAGFQLGERTGGRVDSPDGFATCAFENGVCVELGHAVAYFLPTEVMNEWTDAGGIGGAFGQPTDDPRTDTTGAAPMSFQEFRGATYLFGLTGKPSFAVPAAVWQASVSGRPRIGQPTGPPEPVGSDPGIRKVPHSNGVVLAVADSTPVALEVAVFGLWLSRQQSGQSMGAPVGLPYLAEDDTSIHYHFENGTIVPGPAGPTA
jgi:hypothetical protein